MIATLQVLIITISKTVATLGSRDIECFHHSKVSLNRARPGYQKMKMVYKHSNSTLLIVQVVKLRPREGWPENEPIVSPAITGIFQCPG